MPRSSTASHAMRHRPLARAALLAIIPAALTLSGCNSGDTKSQQAQLRPRLIDPEPIVARFNDRTSRVTSLWARASVVIEGKDSEGRGLRERAEGHFQIIPPNRVAMSLGKIGNTNLYFGSDEIFYWWFDMIDGDNKAATVGRHAHITPEKIDTLGLPIDPLDLIDALGITPLPTDMRRIVAKPGPVDGTVILSAPTRRGVRRYTLDENTAEPSRVELIGPGGVPVLDVALSRYRMLKNLDEGEAPLRAPGRIVVRMNGFDGELRFSLEAHDRRKIRPVAFRVDLLIDAYGITKIIDLDEPAPGSQSAEPMEAGDLP